MKHCTDYNALIIPLHPKQNKTECCKGFLWEDVGVDQKVTARSDRQQTAWGLGGVLPSNCWNPMCINLSHLSTWRVIDLEEMNLTPDKILSE